MSVGLGGFSFSIMVFVHCIFNICCHVHNTQLSAEINNYNNVF